MFGNNFISQIPRTTFNLPRILNGISKTLGVVNRAIPLYQQAKPMIEKSRTLFKAFAEINKTSKPKETNKMIPSIKKETPLKKSVSLNQPIFFQ